VQPYQDSHNKWLKTAFDNIESFPRDESSTEPQGGMQETYGRNGPSKSIDFQVIKAEE
jgi:hypothetical protein